MTPTWASPPMTGTVASSPGTAAPSRRSAAARDRGPGPVRPVLDLDRAGPNPIAVGQRERVNTLGPALDQQAGHRVVHQPPLVAAGAAGPFRVRAHGVGHPALGRARGRDHQRPEGPCQPGQRQREQRRAAAVHAGGGGRLTWPVPRPCAGSPAAADAPEPGTRASASRSARRWPASQRACPSSSSGSWTCPRRGRSPGARSRGRAARTAGSAGHPRSARRLSASCGPPRRGSPHPSGWLRPAPAAHRPGRARSAAWPRPAAACWPTGEAGHRGVARADHLGSVGGRPTTAPRCRDRWSLTARPQRPPGSRRGVR